jgi:hypothetical protein
MRMVPRLGMDGKGEAEMPVLTPLVVLIGTAARSVV